MNFAGRGYLPPRHDVRYFLMPSDMTIDNRNFLVVCWNCSQFIVESEIKVFLLQDAKLRYEVDVAGSGLSLGRSFGNTGLKK